MANGKWQMEEPTFTFAIFHFRFSIPALLTLLWPLPLLAQYQPPSDVLIIQGKSAATWSQGSASIIEIDGDVSIDLDRTHLSSQRAVIWLEPAPQQILNEQRMTIALMGAAQLQQPEVTRQAEQLLVNANVQGTIRLSADNRVARDLSGSELYQNALALRQSQPAPLPSGAPVSGGPTIYSPTTEPATRPAARPAPTLTPILFRGDVQTVNSSDGKLALLFPNGVSLSRKQGNGDEMEMQADRAVLFTSLSRAREITQIKDVRLVQSSIVGAYLEGDVRINVVPSPDNRTRGEQRMEGNRVYYDFTTDRAVLTDAVIHTMDPRINIPIIVRAENVRQLSEGEYKAQGIELTTSGFAVPSYSIRADKAYLREVDTGDPRYGNRMDFVTHDMTINAWHVPLFWLPAAAGSMTERGTPLRNLEVGNTKDYGFQVRTEWGVLETLGIWAPQDLDLSMRLDYYTDRGPGAGLDGRYGGGFATDTTKKIWNFEGDFKSYFVPDDTGFDDLGKHRAKVTPPDTFRGFFVWQHQHFFPDDWQVQLRTGWTSDATFLEQWFEDTFNDGLPLETSAYLKRQRGSEAFTLLVSVQPNDLVTTSDMIQERIPDKQFPGTTLDKPFEIERVPEIGYHRIGDSLGDDSATFFSDNTFSGLHYNASSANLGEYGFRKASNGHPAALPGLPSLGTTGTTDEWVYRGDFRQELDYPFSLQQIKVLPYVEGRYTGYSDSPASGQINRLFVGTGVRFNTMFWKIDDSAESELFDIHRVRHIIEPELHLFTSAQTEDREHVFIYDEPVDAINDVSAVSVALRQRWQTKRGGPGNERSVDFFTLSIEANFYANQPPDTITPPPGVLAPGNILAPGDFRGLFFPSLPEASIPRDSINSEALWRISDSSVILADAYWNADKQNLATASIGFAARRGDHLGYFVGERYIEELHSAITTVAAQYAFTPKYTFIVSESFDFGNQHDVYSSIGIQRKFERFFLLLTVFRDEVNDNSGFNIAIYPEGLGRGLSSAGFNSVFGTSR